MPRNVELEHNSAVPEHVHAITLVRHGRTAYNAQHRLQGQIDIPLDEVGQWQVRQTADALRELLIVVPIFRTGWSSVPIWGVPQPPRMRSPTRWA